MKNNFISLPHPMIKNLDEVQELNSGELNFELKSAEFTTGNIVLSVKEKNKKEIINQVIFLDTTDRAEIQSVDFSSGEITIRWLPEGTKKIRSLAGYNVTLEEIELIRSRKKIPAIRSIRERIGCGLREGKELAEQVADMIARQQL